MEKIILVQNILSNISSNIFIVNLYRMYTFVTSIELAAMLIEDAFYKKGENIVENYQDSTQNIF